MHNTTTRDVSLWVLAGIPYLWDEVHPRSEAEVSHLVGLL